MGLAGATDFGRGNIINMEIGVFGAGWGHAYSTTWYKKSQNVTWCHNQPRDINFFVDGRIPDCINSKLPRRFCWQVESIDLFPHILPYIKEHSKEISENCEFLFSHNREVVSLADNFIYMSPHGFWPDNPHIATKTKLVSFLTSSKSWLEGHRKRLEWLQKVRERVDLYGQGFNPVERVEEALEQYCFSFSLENSDLYFSEKLLNNFVLGTIPITICDKVAVSELFNTDGIIFLDESFDINSLSFDFYYSKMDAIEDNFERALKYDAIEDIIWRDYINKVC